MKITIAQLNPIIGDIEGNLSRIISVLDENPISDLIVFSELFLTGYPPRDLLEKEWFVKNVESAVDKLCEVSKKYTDTGILFGAPTFTGKKVGNGLYNSAILICDGKVIFKQDKSLLPTYDVFEEARYFDIAPQINTFKFKGETLGISICEDAWNDPELWPKRKYIFEPIEELANLGATMFINISASPFYVGRVKVRHKVISNHAKKHGISFIYVNQIGANDELIFDGKSMVIDKDGSLIEKLSAFEEEIKTIDTENLNNVIPFKAEEDIESVYNALILGIKDYARKCGFKKAILGLSGGIDSTVVSCLAAEALGSQNVLAISMPSPYSSKGSWEDSRKLAKNLGIDYKEISITPIYNSYIEALRHDLNIDESVDVTLENIQARIRGNILMAFSNKFGNLVLSTGNKSELSIGYCTLYGDMSGGLAVISDVPKTMVYDLARYINRVKEIIPNEIITKPPSAELRPDQKDQDSLPAYEVLDDILYHYIDKGFSAKQIVNLEHDKDIVKWTINAVNRNEYKRRQAAPGLKVTSKAFGMGRRMLITSKFEA